MRKAATALPFAGAVPDWRRGSRRARMIGYLVVFVGAGSAARIRHGMNIWSRAGSARTSLPHLIINIVGSLIDGLVAAWFAVQRPGS